MTTKNKRESIFFQLRKDLVSGTWVLFSTKRSQRPDLSKKEEKKKKSGENKKNCPFCKENITDQEKDVLVYMKKDGDWSLKVFPNKFPALSSEYKDINKRDHGPFEVIDGVGYHEVLVTEDHKKDIPDMEIIQIAEILDAYQERYLALMNRKHIKYISIFKNYGCDAGASIEHPHSQIVAMPIVDPDVFRSINGSESYFNTHKECVHCAMIEWEKESGKRLLFENEEFMAVCPFVSRVPFEMRIYPKRHLSYFERITDEQKIKLAEVMKFCLSKLKKNLNDPAYNLFLHTAPCNGQPYDHYHWHFEIFPKTNTWAGLELSTGIEVCSIIPERAAEILRE
ncbi:MAG: galactose-1-phosphate uridylyltransferase [Candidatus Andersenbacteria bacterium]|nr:galactose-1-phosphate uridylyltransferase [Candidatus Andersenbacteria bacterium]